MYTNSYDNDNIDKIMNHTQLFTIIVSIMVATALIVLVVIPLAYNLDKIIKLANTQEAEGGIIEDLAQQKGAKLEAYLNDEQIQLTAPDQLKPSPACIHNSEPWGYIEIYNLASCQDTSMFYIMHNFTPKMELSTAEYTAFEKITNLDCKAMLLDDICTNGINSDCSCG